MPTKKTHRTSLPPHLSRHLETISEWRPSLAWDYMAVGPRGEEMASRWAREMADLLRQHGGGNPRIAALSGAVAVLVVAVAAALTVLGVRRAHEQQAAAERLAREQQAVEQTRQLAEQRLEQATGAIRPGDQRRAHH